MNLSISEHANDVKVHLKLRVRERSFVKDAKKVKAEKTNQY